MHTRGEGWRACQSALHPVHVAQEGGADGLHFLLVNSRRKEPAHLIQTDHFLVGVGAQAVVMAAATIAVKGLLVPVYRRHQLRIGIPAIHVVLVASLLQAYPFLYV